MYVNQEQFNKDFLKSHYGSAKGARWKVCGSPNGHGGMQIRAFADQRREFMLADPQVKDAKP